MASNSFAVNIVLLNVAGRRVYETTYQQPAGSMVKQINMKQMAAGIYYISVFADDKKITTEKIFKK